MLADSVLLESVKQYLTAASGKYGYVVEVEALPPDASISKPPVVFGTHLELNQFFGTVTMLISSTQESAVARQALLRLIYIVNDWTETSMRSRLVLKEAANATPVSRPALASVVTFANADAVAAAAAPASVARSEPAASSSSSSSALQAEPLPAFDLEEWKKQNKAAVSGTTADKNALLCEAAADGLEAAVSFLLAHGAKADATDVDKRTPLHHAAAGGSVAVAALLLEHGASARTEDMTKLTPLHLAAENGHVAMASLLIERGAADVNAGDEYRRTAMHQALKRGHVLVAERLVAAGANPNAKNAFNSAPLHIAAKTGRADVVRWLLARKSMVPTSELVAFDEFDRTPLHHACEGGHVEAVRLMLEHYGRSSQHASSSSSSGTSTSSTPSSSSSFQHLANLRNKKDKLTPLHLAARYGHLEVVQHLVDHAGAAVNAADNRQQSTPLHLALRNGQVRVVRFLLDRGADVNGRDAGGMTPLDVAKVEGRGEEVVGWLVALGAVAGVGAATAAG
ncbi:ankyrin repeat-containing domain protein [Zopfochytrium polystomum]|nr:ankyrin repeat-containing domain protein [Zopfochytrium polystomum]